MAAIGKTHRAPQIVSLQKPVKGDSLWSDSWRRLRRNKAAILGIVVIVLNILMAIFAPLIAPRPFDKQVLTDSGASPLWVTKLFPSMIPQEEGGYVKISEDYPIGADNLGRDLLSRIIYGARVSLTVAFVGPVFSLLIGLVVGMIAGYFGGRWDNMLMRVVDIMYAFPTLLFIILLMSFFRTTVANPPPGSFAAVIGEIDSTLFNGMLFIILGLSLTSWMQMARLVRGQVLSARSQEYVEAARAIGAARPKIMFGHILPNILGTLIVAETLTIPTYISYEAFLSFIGLGVSPPTPSWGSMIAEGSKAISSYPNLALFPALALFLIMFAFNFLGDGLRDALDPRMRGRD